MNTPAETTIDLTALSWVGDGGEPFREPYVDLDEWRTEPVPHRYVHGGFRDGDTRFSLYLPPAELFEGRFFQHVTPVPQSENLAQTRFDAENPIPFSIASGGYYVETNGGGPLAADPMSGLDPSIGAYRANAAVARLSRDIALKIYGVERIFGYLYGGSGGGYRTIGASENTVEVWDGFVPYVIGSPMAIPNVFAVRMHAQRILRDRFPQIVDAYDAGGDPTTLRLSTEEQDALDEVTSLGFPPRSWFGWETMGMHAFSVLYPGILLADPGFAADFWALDGYLGADPESSVHRDRVQLDTTVAALVFPSATPDGPDDHVSGGVDESFKSAPTRHGSERQTASPVGIRLRDRPSGWTLGAELRIRSGRSAGTVLRLASVEGSTALFEPGQEPVHLELGDEVVLDNSTFLAAQTYHRHQVPTDGYPVWDRFRDTTGAPVLPQRPALLGPIFTARASGTVPTGRIGGKMIVVASLLDREAFPWQADWYRGRVAEHLGAAAGDRFRLWFTDNALHGDESGVQEHETRTVSYVGALQAALRQLSAWVELGIEPAASTDYTVTDGQVLVRTDDSARGGVQPIVSLTVDGGERADVAVGEVVRVTLDARAVEGAGTIVSVATDLTGSGRLDEPEPVDASASVTIEYTRVFDEPGTYFLTARVTAQIGGDGHDRYARVQNVARARVVVREDQLRRNV